MLSINYKCELLPKHLHFALISDKIVKNSVERMLSYMKKRILSLFLSVCMLVTIFTCVASAADVSVDKTLPTIVRLCPGTIIGENTEDVLPVPDVYGPIYSQGWEIKAVDGEWVPYDGHPLELEDDGAVVRYYAVTFSNNADDYEYSNECELIVEHNPTGSYLYSGTNHWRVCADCGGKADDELHDHFENPKAGNSVCGVCGAPRTSQWTGLASFFDWLLDFVLVRLLPLFGL